MNGEKQRRNRRKEREVSDHSLVYLHKYYLRAEYMRGAFYNAREQFVEKYGTSLKRQGQHGRAFQNANVH